MKRLSTILVLILAVAVMGNVAKADLVTYTTSGVFSNFTSGNFGGFGDASGNGTSFGSTNYAVFNNGGGNEIGILFKGSSVSLNTDFTGSLGTFQTSWTANNPNTPINVAGDFTLTINQSTPTGGTGIFTSSLTGHFFLNGGGGTVTFDQSSVTIGSVTYSLNHSGVVGINAPGTWLGYGHPSFENSFGGASSIEANVSVPEPASLALFGSGLLMGGNFIRRKVMGV
jgi:hypothetical protein